MTFHKDDEITVRRSYHKRARKAVVTGEPYMVGNYTLVPFAWVKRTTGELNTGQHVAIIPQDEVVAR